MAEFQFTEDATMRKLVSGVHQFQKSAFAERRELFENLANGQHPHTLFITCADSRIDPTLLTQAPPGDLFILRNAGNLVPTYGKEFGAEAAGIEYALAALDVEHIVICGHSHCGAMSALVDPKLAEELPAVSDWLSHAAATRRVVTENYGDLSSEDAINVTIQENVLIQLENLRTHPMVAARLAAGRLHLHGWVYKIETGEVFVFNPAEGQFNPISDIDSMQRPRLLGALSSAP
jgi:carbonic anhydrase